MTMNGYKYFDTTMPIHEQIAYAKHFVRVKAEGYHRVQFYLDFVLREYAIEMFENIIGRLPSVTEMAELVTYANTDHIIEHILLNINTYPVTLKDGEKKTRDQLFYHTETQPYTWKIYQVKNYLSTQIAMDGLDNMLVNGSPELSDVPLDFFTNNNVHDGEGQLDSSDGNTLVLGSEVAQDATKVGSIGL